MEVVVLPPAQAYPLPTPAACSAPTGTCWGTATCPRPTGPAPRRRWGPIELTTPVVPRRLPWSGSSQVREAQAAGDEHVGKRGTGAEKPGPGRMTMLDGASRQELCGLWDSDGGWVQWRRRSLRHNPRPPPVTRFLYSASSEDSWGQRSYKNTVFCIWPNPTASPIARQMSGREKLQ